MSFKAAATSSRRERLQWRSTELQPTAWSHIEQLGLEVKLRAAPQAYARAVPLSIVPGQEQRGHGQPGEPNRPSGSLASYKRIHPAKLLGFTGCLRNLAHPARFRGGVVTYLNPRSPPLFWGKVKPKRDLSIYPQPCQPSLSGWRHFNSQRLTSKLTTIPRMCVWENNSFLLITTVAASKRERGLGNLLFWTDYL